MQRDKGSPLGSYLRDRRERLEPAALGFSLTRRRTPGLRREEVAQRAHVSATWYTWLEQGRGGAPSADVLDRVARALMLTDAEREHAYLLAFGRQPDVRTQATGAVTPRLQRVLDALERCPAYVMTSTWDVIAWNRAATLVLTDYAALPPEQRNILCLIFCAPHVRAAQADWLHVARFAVAAFRADAARAGAGARVTTLVDELTQRSPEFGAIWRENDVRSTYGEFAKAFVHPLGGAMALEHSAFAVDGRPDLHLVIFTPTDDDSARKIAALL